MKSVSKKNDTDMQSGFFNDHMTSDLTNVFSKMQFAVLHLNYLITYDLK